MLPISSRGQRTVHSGEALGFIADCHVSVINLSACRSFETMMKHFFLPYTGMMASAYETVRSVLQQCLRVRDAMQMHRCLCAHVFRGCCLRRVWNPRADWDCVSCVVAHRGVVSVVMDVVGYLVTGSTDNLLKVITRALVCMCVMSMIRARMTPASLERDHTFKCSHEYAHVDPLFASPR